jgi:hypothetical protein
MLFSVVIVGNEFYGQNCMKFKIGNKLIGNETNLKYFVVKEMNRHYKNSGISQQSIKVN